MYDRGPGQVEQSGLLLLCARIMYVMAECLCLPKFKYRNPNSLNVMVFRDAASEEVIKVKSCHEDGVLIR